MVSKARLDLPEPERPVTTMSLSRGISTDRFFRLCTRAPCTAIVVRADALLPAPAFFFIAGLEVIGRFPQVDERLFLNHDVAPLRELHGRRGLTDEPLIGQVFACRGHPLNVEIPLEVSLDLGRRPR